MELQRHAWAGFGPGAWCWLFAARVTFRRVSQLADITRWQSLWGSFLTCEPPISPVVRTRRTPEASRAESICLRNTCCATCLDDTEVTPPARERLHCTWACRALRCPPTQHILQAGHPLPMGPSTWPPPTRTCRGRHRRACSQLLRRLPQPLPRPDHPAWGRGRPGLVPTHPPVRAPGRQPLCCLHLGLVLQARARGHCATRVPALQGRPH